MLLSPWNATRVDGMPLGLMVAGEANGSKLG